MPSRWQEEETEEDRFTRFRDAVINALDANCSHGRHYDPDLERYFSVAHGSAQGVTIREVLWKAKTRREIALALEQLLESAGQVPKNFYAITNQVDAVADAIRAAITHHPRINLRLVAIGEVYELHPAGASELDESVVDLTVEWLGRYPSVQEHARRSLRRLAEDDTFESLNSIRVALETLVRAVLQNSKSLENQIGTEPSGDAPFLKWLRERGMKPQTVTMGQRITSSFCDLQNSWVKHPPAAGASFVRAEAEYAVYVVFSLMRLISKLADAAEV